MVSFLLAFVADGPSCWGTVWALGGLSVVLSRVMGKHVAAVIATAVLPLPFLLPIEEGLWRAIVALASFFYFVRALEAIYQPRFMHETLLRVVAISLLLRCQ